MRIPTMKHAAIVALCGAWLTLAGCEEEPQHRAEGLPMNESTPERRDGSNLQQRERAPETGAEADRPAGASEPAAPPPADQPAVGD